MSAASLLFSFGFSMLVFFSRPLGGGLTVVPLGFLVGGVKLEMLEREVSKSFGFRSEVLKSNGRIVSFFL